MTTWEDWLRLNGVDPDRLQSGDVLNLSDIVGNSTKQESTEPKPTRTAGKPTKPRRSLSPAQIKFEAAWKRYGNPAYPITDDSREYRFHPVRQWRADYRFGRVLVEIEGMMSKARDHEGRHRSFSGFLSDAEKYNAAILAGYVVYRIPSLWLYPGKHNRAKQVCEDLNTLLQSEHPSTKEQA